jgi:hypothetical protein
MRTQEKNYSPKAFATSTFMQGLKGGALILSTAILIVCLIILMSEQI